MRIAVINAGMRKGRNTDALIDSVIEGLRRGLDESLEKHEVVNYDLRKMKIGVCTGCYGCKYDGNCVISDDMAQLYCEFDTADIIIFASPVYFNSITAIGKAMIDRCQIYWSRRFELNVAKTKKRKKGIMLISSGSNLKPIEVEGSRQILKIFYMATDCDFEKETILRNSDVISVEDRKAELDEITEEYRKYAVQLV